MVLHWVLAVLIVAELAAGAFTSVFVPNDSLTKIDLLRYHMAVGILIFVMMLTRFVLRWKTVPRHGRGAWPSRERVVELSFYAAVFAMAVSGMTTALQANLNEIVFASSGDPLPATLTVYPGRLVHRYVALSIVGLLVLHVAAAIASHRRGGRALGRMSLRSAIRAAGRK